MDLWFRTSTSHFVSCDNSSDWAAQTIRTRKHSAYNSSCLNYKSSSVYCCVSRRVIFYYPKVLSQVQRSCFIVQTPRTRTLLHHSLSRYILSSTKPAQCRLQVLTKEKDGMAPFYRRDPMTDEKVPFPLYVIWASMFVVAIWAGVYNTLNERRRNSTTTGA